MRTHSDSTSGLKRELEQAGLPIEYSTLRMWRLGLKAPAHAESLEVFAFLERRWGLAPGFFRDRLPHPSRAIKGQAISGIGAAERRRPVFMMSRFDRTAGGGRRPFCSALTALSASDGETRSYLELIDVLRQDGAHAPGDAAQLWRRMVFNVLISNTDDHLRNHGFLREPGGWRLSPAFDLNPMPTDVKRRVHALALNETDPEASLDTVLSVAPYFGLGKAEAAAIARDVGMAVSGWREVAAAHGLTPNQIDRMASAFEHEDLARATA